MSLLYMGYLCKYITNSRIIKWVTCTSLMSTVKHERLENINLSPVYFDELNVSIACISQDRKITQRTTKRLFSYHDIQLATPLELSMHS